ncbi:MAG: TonB family protein, partial [Acidobacteriia bacterium]|nr:TonB family protein [Terriglobia bacterium]
DEPEWMLDLRLKGLKLFRRKPMPNWGADLTGIDFDNIKYFVRSTEKQAASWDDLPADIKSTYDRLGIPEAEKQRLVSGVAAQYESEVVYHQINEELERQGVIFVDTDTGLREYPELFKEYFASVIPVGDNKFAALNTAVWSVLMPADAAEWTADRRAMVLLHELAHVRRGDAATHLLARAALSLYWWNPLAWLAWRQFVKERERAADDVVLNAGARAAEYAGHLLDVARTLQAQPAAGWAVAMARRSQLEGRLLAILDSRANRQSPGRAAALAGVMLAIALVAPFAAIQAQIPSAAPEVDATMRAAASQKNYEMLEQAAAAYENLKNYDAAGQLLEAALAIRGDLSGQNSPDYAAGLLKLGDLARRRNKPAEAANFYAKAVALGDTPEAAGALIFIGTQSLRNTARAQDFFERALAVAPSGPLAGRAKTWQARLAQFEGDASQAELLYLQALAMNPPETPDAALTMELYATLLRQQARPDEAEPYEARAAAVRQAHAAEVSPRRADAEPALKIGRSAEGEIVPPKLLEKVEPVYTQEAKAAKLAGTMRVYVEIATDGRAYNMRIVQGLGLGLEDAAVDAISQWRFQPATRDGIPVPAQATVEINWRLM